MKVYLDTNVLVAASVQQHPHHVQSFDLLQAVKEGALQGYISSHGLAEYYSVLTRAPFIPRIHPVEAGRFLDDNILPFLNMVEVSGDDYKAVLRYCSHTGLTGGIVFDALHLHCARKVGAERIYTFNVKDFRAIAPNDMEGRITAP